MSEPAARAASTTSATATTTGPRIGRRGTLLTLYVTACGAPSGSGGGRRSKIFPLALAIFAFVPAIIQLGVGAIVSGVDEHVELFKHEDYFTYVRIILVLFCAAVAPELVGRDQRNRTLSLYFSRAVSRFDYTLAKFAALTSAMLVLTLGPQLLLFIGNGMAADDLGGYIARQLGSRLSDRRRIVPGLRGDRRPSGSASPPTCPVGPTRPRRSSARSCSRCRSPTSS